MVRKQAQDPGAHLSVAVEKPQWYPWALPHSPTLSPCSGLSTCRHAGLTWSASLSSRSICPATQQENPIKSKYHSTLLTPVEFLCVSTCTPSAEMPSLSLIQHANFCASPYGTVQVISPNPYRIYSSMLFAPFASESWHSMVICLHVCHVRLSSSRTKMYFISLSISSTNT